MRIEISININPFINAALSRNDTQMYLIESIDIKNNGPLIRDAHLKLVTKPFLTEFIHPVDLDIGRNETVSVDISNIADINPSHLLNLSKSFICKLKAVLYVGDSDVIAESDVYNVKLLTCNTWPACSNRRVLSAFVVTSQPSVMNDTDTLRKLITPRDVRKNAVEIVKILRDKKLKKKDLPDEYYRYPYEFRIYEEFDDIKSCTELDMALAFTTLAESIGLKPLIGLFERGVMIGIWDVPNASISQHGNAERQWKDGMRRGDLLVLDPDMLFAGSREKDIFGASQRSDKGFLDDVIDVVDSHRTISPISFRLMAHGIKNYLAVKNSPQQPQTFMGIPLRMMGWKARLLDISLGSNLVDIKNGAVEITIGNEDNLAVLQSMLLGGEPMTARFIDIYSSDVNSELFNNRIAIPTHYKNIMKNLYGDIGDNLKETGIGGGCIGLGAVVWKDKKDGKEHTAPLVLISVNIRKLNRDSYSMNHPDMDEAAINIVLLERLRTEWGVTIPPLDMFIQNGKVDIPMLVDTLRSECEIEYRPEAYFGIFGLDRNAMWNDLDKNYIRMLDNPIVRHLTDGDSLNDGEPFEISYDLNGLHPVLPVDSSQISAINAAVNGRSFVLRGPPGTGKSQTIANMICELIYRGKTVLFVSEKVPALDVINRQLNTVGVSNFCLGVYGKEKKNSTFVDRLLRNYEGAMDGDYLDEEEEPPSVTIDALDKYYESMFSEAFNGGTFYGLYNRYLDALMNDPIPDHLEEATPMAKEYFGTEISKLDELQALIPEDSLFSDMKYYVEFDEATINTIRSVDYEVLSEELPTIISACRRIIQTLKGSKFKEDLSIPKLKDFIESIRTLTSFNIPLNGNTSAKRVIDDVVKAMDRLRSTLSGYRTSWHDAGSNGSMGMIDEIVRQMGILAKSEMTLTLGAREIQDDHSEFTLIHDEIEELSERKTWADFSKYMDTDSKSIADDFHRNIIQRKDSYEQAEKLKGLLNTVISVSGDRYEIVDKNPFKVSEMITSYKYIVSSWNRDLTLEEFDKSIYKFKKTLDSIARSGQHLKTAIGSKLDISDWAGTLKKLESELYKEPSNSFLRRKLSTANIIRDIDGVVGLIERYTSLKKSVDTHWKDTIFSDLDVVQEAKDNVGSGFLSAILMRKKKFVNFVNSNYSKYQMTYEDIVYGIDFVPEFTQVIERLSKVIDNLDRSVTEMFSLVEKVTVLRKKLVRYMDFVPKWRDYYDDGCFSSESKNMELMDACKAVTNYCRKNDIPTAILNGIVPQFTVSILDFIMGEASTMREIVYQCDRASAASDALMEDLDGLNSRIEDARASVALLATLGNKWNHAHSIEKLAQSIDDIDNNMADVLSNASQYDSIVVRQYSSGTANIPDLVNAAEMVLSNIDSFGKYKRLLDSAEDIDPEFYDELVQMVGHYPRTDVVRDIDHAYLESIMDSVLMEKFGLDSYYNGVLDRYEDEVRKAYDAMYKQNRHNLLAVLSNRLNDNDDHEEFDYLRSIPPSSSKTVQDSISTVLSNISNVLRYVSPCMIMNVQSVSRYLDFDRISFDYIIFDESSQIPVEDAIASISRGSTCIIVGDTNQLPPTTFFKNNVVDYINTNDETESILEECIFKGIPSLKLEWHYRSNHESLIAFSNNEFYDNRLITFPSVSDQVSMVGFEFVQNGRYLRGKGYNPDEAARVVDVLYRICEDPEMSKSSIGIVTFGTGQMDEINKALDRRMEYDYNHIISNKLNNTREPLFVKNLESIQGEERDIIIISVGYGRDERGKLIMNFGPLNQSRGWRRLNVAISRSRERMIVCSSIRAKDIIVTEKTRKGILELRGFLEYAETGRFDRKILSADVIDPILPSIAKEIENMGYEVSLNIGKSELRIDIAVMDPANRNVYCLAILLDRNLYDNSRNPVDRDYTKYKFLKKMGWKVLRVHTIDWMLSKDYVLNKIRNALPELVLGPPRTKHPGLSERR